MTPRDHFTQLSDADLAEALMLLAAAKEMREALVWRLINTAPKDGSEILIGGGLVLYDVDTIPDWNPFLGVTIAAWKWRDGSGGADGWRGEPCHSHDDWAWHRPTHWMPLPSPPTPSEQEHG